MIQSNELVWIRVDGGVIGFELEEVQACMAAYRKAFRPGTYDFWNYFTWQFSDELRGKEAHGISSLWTQPDIIRQIHIS